MLIPRIVCKQSDNLGPLDCVLGEMIGFSVVHPVLPLPVLPLSLSSVQVALPLSTLPVFSHPITPSPTLHTHITDAIKKKTGTRSLAKKGYSSCQGSRQQRRLIMQNCIDKWPILSHQLNKCLFVQVLLAWQTQLLVNNSSLFCFCWL